MAAATGVEKRRKLRIITRGHRPLFQVPPRRDTRTVTDVPVVSGPEGAAGATAGKNNNLSHHHQVSKNDEDDFYYGNDAGGQVYPPAQVASVPLYARAAERQGPPSSTGGFDAGPGFSVRINQNGTLTVDRCEPGDPVGIDAIGGSGGSGSGSGFGGGRSRPRPRHLQLPSACDDAMWGPSLSPRPIPGMPTSPISSSLTSTSSSSSAMLDHPMHGGGGAFSQPSSPSGGSWLPHHQLDQSYRHQSQHQHQQQYHQQSPQNHQQYQLHQRQQGGQHPAAVSKSSGHNLNYNHQQQQIQQQHHIGEEDAPPGLRFVGNRDRLASVRTSRSSAGDPDPADDLLPLLFAAPGRTLESSLRDAEPTVSPGGKSPHPQASSFASRLAAIEDEEFFGRRDGDGDEKEKGKGKGKGNGGEEEEAEEEEDVDAVGARIVARAVELACESIPTMARGSRWRALCALGDAARRYGQTLIAVSAHTLACGVQPRAVQPWLDLAKCYEDVGDPVDSLAVEKGVTAGPQSGVSSSSSSSSGNSTGGGGGHGYPWSAKDTHQLPCCAALAAGLAMCPGDETLLTRTLKSRVTPQAADAVLLRLRGVPVAASWRVLMEGAQTRDRAAAIPDDIQADGFGDDDCNNGCGYGYGDHDDDFDIGDNAGDVGDDGTASGNNNGHRRGHHRGHHRRHHRSSGVPKRSSQEVWARLVRCVPWYGPVHLEAAQQQERAGTPDGFRRALAIVTSGLAEIPRYGPLWFLAFRLHERMSIEEGCSDFDSGTTPASIDPFSSARGAIEAAVRLIAKELVWKVHLESARLERRAGSAQRAREALALAAASCPASLQWKVWLSGARLELQLRHDSVNSARKKDNGEACHGAGGNPTAALPQGQQTPNARVPTVEALLGRALATAPQRALTSVHLERSRYLEYLGEPSAAVLHLRECIEGSSHADDWKLWLELVLLQERCGRLPCPTHGPTHGTRPPTCRCWLLQALSDARDGVAAFPGAGRLWAALIRLSLLRGQESQLRVFASALLAVAKSGEVWCEAARVFLNPHADLFDPARARRYLDYAAAFTPQYGDTFIEMCRAHLIVRGPHADTSDLEAACVNADPNYGAAWFFCRSSPLVSTREAFRIGRRLIARDLALHAGVYQRAIDGCGQQRRGAKKRKANENRGSESEALLFGFGITAVSSRIMGAYAQEPEERRMLIYGSDQII